ncbi:MAG: succinate dehydrogenase, cytochrome b556 subunit [Chloroflexi bacterium]|nr:succinate dehydrogenase, cytochrome b556 subunit [Chloroflexota bacterium]
MTQAQESRLRRAARWADVRKRRTGMWAFALNRITGIGLVVYLYLHLVVLSMLAGGPESWDSFVRLARSRAFLALDVLLIAGALIHGLNGVRVALTGFGVGVRTQKALFGGLMAVAAVALFASALKILGG